jgi:glycosyltransferase involved in cell wall biosynthesis
MNPEYIDAAGCLWRLLGKRVVLWYAHKSTPWTLRFAMPFIDIVATASSESFRIDSPKVRITGHGIDLGRVSSTRTPSTDGTIRLISTSRIAPVKHVDVLIKAFLELKRRGVRVSLKAFGRPATADDEEYQASLEKLLRESGVEPGSVLVGAVPNAELPRHRAEADYLVSASSTGSLDKNVLDAAYARVIPISSNDAFEEFFTGFEQYLRYPAGDSNALADRIEALETLSEEEREHIRSTLRERVAKEHSLTTLIDRLQKLIDGV